MNCNITLSHMYKKIGSDPIRGSTDYFVHMLQYDRRHPERVKKTVDRCPVVVRKYKVNTLHRQMIYGIGTFELRKGKYLPLRHLGYGL